jgi:hypothetical protein
VSAPGQILGGHCVPTRHQRRLGGVKGRHQFPGIQIGGHVRQRGAPIEPGGPGRRGRLQPDQDLGPGPHPGQVADDPARAVPGRVAHLPVRCLEIPHQAGEEEVPHGEGLGGGVQFWKHGNPFGMGP